MSVSICFKLSRATDESLVSGLQQVRSQSVCSGFLVSLMRALWMILIPELDTLPQIRPYKSDSVLVKGLQLSAFYSEKYGGGLLSPSVVSPYSH